MIAVGSVVTTVYSNITAAVVVSRYRRTIQRAQRMSQNQKPLNSTEKRLAFYAGLLHGCKLKLTDDEAEEWRDLLPLAIDGQQFLIAHGQLPQKMTLQNVRTYADFEKRRDKTLD